MGDQMNGTCVPKRITTTFYWFMTWKVWSQTDSHMKKRLLYSIRILYLRHPQIYNQIKACTCINYPTCTCNERGHGCGHGRVLHVHMGLDKGVGVDMGVGVGEVM